MKSKHTGVKLQRQGERERGRDRAGVGRTESDTGMGRTDGCGQ